MFSALWRRSNILVCMSTSPGRGDRWCILIRPDTAGGGTMAVSSSPVSRDYEVLFGLMLICVTDQ